MRFEEHEDHYLDNITGIKWSKENFAMTWDEAMSSPNGWRLPTIEELLTIVQYKIDDMPTDLPEMMDYFYWSSSVHIYDNEQEWYDNEYAWGVHFYSGVVNNYHKTIEQYVRYIKED